MTNIPSITASEFLNGIVKTGGNCVVDVWAEWCRPCKIVSPILEELSDKYKNIRFYKINIGEYGNMDIVVKFGIKSVPTVLLVKDGKVVDKIVGTRDAAHFEERIRKLLGDEDTEHIEEG